MNFTPEQLKKAKTAKSVEELIALAKENGLELTEEEAKKYFAELHKEGELADEELDNVSGGCGDDPPQPKFQVNQKVYLGNRMNTANITAVKGYDQKQGFVYEIYFLRKHENGTAYEWEMRDF